MKLYIRKAPVQGLGPGNHKSTPTLNYQIMILRSQKGTLTTQDHTANKFQKEELPIKLEPLDSQMKIFYIIQVKMYNQ